MLPIFVAWATLLAGAGALASEPWISRHGEVSPGLAVSQVLLIKDEDLAKDKCLSATEERELRYANKRYFMCPGSILSSRLILTSATCIHHATYVRHNIKAPLAVLVAPFSNTSQIIRIVTYTIHPFYALNPEDYDHAVHDVAVAKLACRIVKDNLKPIKLPKQSIEDECAENNCSVATFHINSMLRYNMYESLAKDIEYASENSGDSDMSEDLDIVNGDDIQTFQDENINKREARNQPKKPSESKEKPKEPDNNKKPDDSEKPNYASNAGNAGVLNFCTFSGAPVMYDNTQPALVSESCDERQKNKMWSYTDLYDNLDWLNHILGINTDSTVTASCNPFALKGSSCHGEEQYSQKDKHGKSSEVNTEIPPHTCPKHRASDSDSENTSVNKPKLNDIKSLNRAYFDAIYKLYRNRNGPPGDESNNGLQ